MVRSITSTVVALLAFAPLLSLAAPTYKRDLKFPYGAIKVRGVNLGGWFVLEPWITPSIFEPWANSNTVVDEYTLCQTLGKDQAYSTLSNHWNTWITESDFAQIAAAGLNHVRIPIGYWSVAPIDGEPYVQGAYDVLNTALGWAQAHGISVWIDLHGGELFQMYFHRATLTPLKLPQDRTDLITAAAKERSDGLKVLASSRPTPLWTGLGTTMHLTQPLWVSNSSTSRWVRC